VGKRYFGSISISCVSKTTLSETGSSKPRFLQEEEGRKEREREAYTQEIAVYQRMQNLVTVAILSEEEGTV
jgi:hypothetical protein